MEDFIRPQIMDWLDLQLMGKRRPFLRPALDNKTEALVATDVKKLFVSERKLLAKVTLTVVVRRDLRCWLGLRFVRLGARLAGLRYRETDHGSDD